MGTVATDNPVQQVQQMQHVQHPAAQIPDKQGRPPLPKPGGGGLPCLSGLDWRYHSDSGVEVPVVARAVAVCEPVVEL